VSDVGIVGLGLIGGSLARDLAAAGRRVVATDRSGAAVAQARGKGIVATELDPDEPPPLVVLAVPVRATPDWIRRLAGSTRPDLVVTDTGSTKRSILDAARGAGLDGFVGSHPVAGSHESGWDASRTGLFRGADVWICPGRDSAPGSIDAVERLWRDVGGRPRRIDAGEHDRLLARCSHLPQLVATALGTALSRLGLPPEALGPGGRDTTRLAASDAAMWTDILLDNADEVRPAIEALADALEELDSAITDGDEQRLRALLAGAREWKAGPS
jgi:prephenate dehydrogenase